ncbi:MAG: IS30 family transposase, partial [Akkermansia sp.]|nr:IS30 family transposase [Akkermansia sp.]
SERGSNENANRLIRRFLPKGTPLSDLKQEDVDVLAMWINCYPRAIFRGQSSRSKTKAFGFHFRKKKEACQ